MVSPNQGETKNMLTNNAFECSNNSDNFTLLSVKVSITTCCTDVLQFSTASHRSLLHAPPAGEMASRWMSCLCLAVSFIVCDRLREHSVNTKMCFFLFVFGGVKKTSPTCEFERRSAGSRSVAITLSRVWIESLQSGLNQTQGLYQHSSAATALKVLIFTLWRQPCVQRSSN